MEWSLLQDQWASWLESPFFEEEIHKAIQSLGTLKSLGPDGMTNEFLKKSWNILKPDLVKLFQDFFEKEIIINKCTNETYICLIMKKLRANKVSDFRPISLFSSLYKIISKVLAERLKKVLPLLIDNSQAAFVEGCHILDAVLVAFETVGDYRSNGKVVSSSS